MSVSEPSYTVKRRNGYQAEGRRSALRAGLCPHLELWLGLAWLGLVSVIPINRLANSFERIGIQIGLAGLIGDFLHAIGELHCNADKRMNRKRKESSQQHVESRRLGLS